MILLVYGVAVIPSRTWPVNNRKIIPRRLGGKKIDTAYIYYYSRVCLHSARSRAAGRWATERTANIHPHTHTHTQAHT